MKLLKASDRPFDPDPALYSDTEWERACLIDHGPGVANVRKRCHIPVREPDGQINAHALAKAAELIREADVHELVKDRAHRRLAKRYAKVGMPCRVPVEKSALSTADRKALPASDFVFPETREYPIPDQEHARNALARGAQNETGARLAKIRAAVGRRYPNIDVSKAESALELAVPIWKDDAKQIVYGVALTPGLMDSQGDVADADEIEKTAHRFLTEYRKHDVQHAEVTTGPDGEPIARTVESFIAPQDMDIAGQRVLKGSWVLATKIHDPVTWERVRKGEITGYSIGGSGERIPLAA